MKKSLLRWAGSKRKLLPVLKEKYNKNYRRYIEPFAGSACLFFELNPPRAILNDINHNLIDMYKAVKYDPFSVFSELRKYEISKEYYYAVRAIEPIDLDNIQKAARFIYLNRYCFNGLYRTNNKGNFNVPFSNDKTGRLPTLNELIGYSELLSIAELVSADFEAVLDLVEKGDFVYMDPPYAIANKRLDNQYGPNTFGLHDIKRLGDTLDRLHHKQVDFVLSYASCDEVETLAAKWNHETVSVNRNIAGFSRYRKMAEEIIISNF